MKLKRNKSPPSQEKLASNSQILNTSKNINKKQQKIEENSIKSARKKYNVINEDVRKKIIKKLTEENGNIKDVSEEYGLKLSTCKAILQVFQKEGRIGKKATRDRKSSIVSTILVARIDPMNPSSSTIEPYIQIAEAKTNSKKTDDNANSDLINEAFKNAQDHLRSVLQNNSQEIYQGQKVPTSNKNQIESTFMEAQKNAIKSILKQNPLPEHSEKEEYTQSTTKPIDSHNPSNIIVQSGTKSSFKQSKFLNPQAPNSLSNPNIHWNKNISGQTPANNSNNIPTNQTDESSRNGNAIHGNNQSIIGIQGNNQSITATQGNNQSIIGIQGNNNHNKSSNQGIQSTGNQTDSGSGVNSNGGQQMFDSNSISINGNDQNELLAMSLDSQRNIKSQPTISRNNYNNQNLQQQNFLFPGVLQNNNNNSLNGFSQNGYGYPQNPNALPADASVFLDQYFNTHHLSNNSQQNFSNIYSPRQTVFTYYSDSPSLTTMNASPAITPFLNPFTLNSPSLSSTQNNYGQPYLSPLNLSANNQFIPQKSSQFSLNTPNCSTEDAATTFQKKSFLSKDFQKNQSNIIMFIDKHLNSNQK